MGKIRTKHSQNNTTLTIPSAAEAYQETNKFWHDEEYVWNLIHDTLAKLINKAISQGKYSLILNRDNFFGGSYLINEQSLYYKVFVNDFIPMLRNPKMGFNYEVNKAELFVFVIKW